MSKEVSEEGQAHHQHGKDYVDPPPAPLIDAAELKLWSFFYRRIQETNKEIEIERWRRREVKEIYWLNPKLFFFLSLDQKKNWLNRLNPQTAGSYRFWRFKPGSSPVLCTAGLSFNSDRTGD